MATPAPDDNPYAAPGAATSPERDRGGVAGVRWHLGWAAVFAANLIIPLLFGWSMTENGGRAGMFAAVAVMVLLGHLAIAGSRRLRAVLVVGGTFVGLSQVFPALQFLAGSVSAAITERLFGVAIIPNDDRMGPDGLSEVSGFALTLLTGGQLLVAAGAAGWIILRLVERFRRDRSAPPA